MGDEIERIALWGLGVVLFNLRDIKNAGAEAPAF